MAKGLSFSAVLKLQKQQFDAGIKQVQKSLNGLKSVFMQVAGALGAGLGLNALVSNMRETATQLSVVKATLENVSDGVIEYRENLEFLNGVAEKYGQNQVALTGSFAKFKTAAQGAGMSLNDVRKIFEAVTRASGAFHLSAEQTQSVMIALEQMASKGKVMSEELRRQLANNLPGAFAKMADAAGRAGITMHGTTGELEEAMKQGRVSADVLKYFADVLNETTEEANFDSLQSSLNRFQNAWTKFVDASGFEDTFKGLVDTGTDVLKTLAANFTAFRHILVDIATLIGGTMGFDHFHKKGVVALNAVKAKSETLDAEIKKLKDDIMGFQMGLVTTEMQSYLDMVSSKLSEEWLLERGINEELVQEIIYQETLKKNGGALIFAEEERLKLKAKIALAQMKVNQKEAEQVVLQKQLNAQGNFFLTTIKGISAAWKGLTASIKGVLAATGWGLIMSVMMELVQLGIDWVKNLTKAEEKVEDITEQVKKIDTETAKNITQAELLGKDFQEVSKQIEEEKILERDTSVLEEKRKRIIGDLNGLLKLSKDKMLTVESTAGDVNDAISKWSDEIKRAAQEMAIFDKRVELTKDKLELQMRLDDIKEDPNYNKKNPKGTRTVPSGGGNPAYTLQTGGGLTKEAQLLDNEAKEIQDKLDKIEKDEEKLDKMSVELKKAAGNAVSSTTSGITGTTKNIKSASETLKDAIKEYQQEVSKLNNQLNRGAIDQEEYQKSMDKTIEKTWKTIAGYENLEGILAKMPPEIRELVSEIEEGFKQVKLDEALEEAFDEAKKAIEKSTDELMDALDKYFEKQGEIMAKGMPELKQRDTFFDYKKSDKDILGESASNMDEHVKDLQDMKEELLELSKVVEGGLDPVMQDFLDQVNEKLKEATKNAKDLRDKANLAELAADVEKFTKAFREAKFDAIKEVASSFDRLVKSIESVDDAIQNLGKSTSEPLDELKALVTIINEIIQVITTVKSVVEGFNTVQEALAAKRKADNAQMIVQAGAIAAAQEAQTAAEAHSAAATVAAEGTKQAAMAATTTAEAGSAIAGAASSVASVPYVGPILAAAAVASMVALFAANLKKFAGGGIVNGPTAGDRNLVRANGGEMILNKHQQSTLFNMLNGGGGANGKNNVEFKIRGADLVGAINNYQSRQRGWG